ncbi:MAG: UDP-N-acetylmuramoyl-L-alanine--D-glutamate ligase [Thermoanaerobaculales bacterium]|nr:UDP-N-acetylmuramoyl-L-alanine--D-glutamate ligase [Thermoanaerobaculales bacterium]
MQQIEYSRVLVIGLGSSGVAAAKLAACDGAEVVVTDHRSSTELGEALATLPANTPAFLGAHPESCLADIDLVVLSPGVAADLPLVETARGRGIDILSELEFAWRHRADAPLIAVTGSNGKSTVTTLTAAILQASGRNTVAGGNLGPPASQLVLEGGWDSWVLEISSFQSETFVALRPQVGVFLNLSQDHLERHPDMAAYAKAKSCLFASQTTDDTIIVNADDPLVAATVTAARMRSFSVKNEADAFLDGDTLRLYGEDLMNRSEIGLAGQHNVANVLAAALAASELGADTQAGRTAVTAFSGLPHRHRVVHESGGVRWIDDSKATNVGAALAALSGYPENSVHIILGGLGKGQDFTPLAAAVAAAAARVYLIGADGPEIGRVLVGAAPCEDAKTLERAVESARKRATTGQYVILAPACASFDQFLNYPARGDRFSALARAEEPRSCP